jgi:hypothetical protein
LWRQIINMAQTLHTVLNLWSWCCAASIAMYSCCHIVGKKYCFCSHYFVSNWQASDFVSDSSWICPSPLARRMLLICQLSLLLIAHRQLDCVCCLNASVSGMELVMGIHLNQVLQWMLRYEYCWMHPVELWSIFCAILEGSCFDIWLHRYTILQLFLDFCLTAVLKSDQFFCPFKTLSYWGSIFGLLGSAGSTGALTAENRHRPKAHFCVWKVTGWSSWISSYKTEPRKGWARFLFSNYIKHIKLPLCTMFWSIGDNCGT